MVSKCQACQRSSTNFCPGRARTCGRRSYLDAVAHTRQMTCTSATGYVPYTADLGDSWGEVGLGGTWQVSDTGYLFADVDCTWIFKGDETSWNSKVGMRWNW